MCSAIIKPQVNCVRQAVRAVVALPADCVLFKLGECRLWGEPTLFFSPVDFKDFSKIVLIIHSANCYNLHIPQVTTCISLVPRPHLFLI